MDGVADGMADGVAGAAADADDDVAAAAAGVNDAAICEQNTEQSRRYTRPRSVTRTEVARADLRVRTRADVVRADRWRSEDNVRVTVAVAVSDACVAAAGGVARAAY